MFNLLPLAFEFTSPGPIAFEIDLTVLRWCGLLISFVIIIGTILAQTKVNKLTINPEIFVGLAIGLVVGAIPFIFVHGPLSIRWYGLLIASAIIFGTVLAQKLGEKRNVDPELVGDFAIWLVVGAIPFARFYYVLFEWPRFQTQEWYKVFATWEGGIAIHGAIIGGAIAATIFCKRQKISTWLMADIFMPAVILGQAIGRWGNFFNSEAFGSPTYLPWKLLIPSNRRPPEFVNESYFHPTFLYESLWNLGVFGILMFAFLRFPKLRTGTVTMLYAIAYSVGRFWIEGLRTDSLMVGGLRTAQMISLAAIAAGIFGLVWLYGLRRRFPDTTPKEITSENL